MIKPNPFTPQTGWEPKIFQGRKNQINTFRANIKEALLTKRPNHMVIMGDWGIGKTSLLKTFKKITQEEGLLATLCSIPKLSDKETTQDAISVIIEEILKGFPVIKGIEKLKEEIEGFGISIAGFGGQIMRKKRISSPQILFSDILIRLWKYLDTKLAIVLIDDIQNFNVIPPVVDILRLVLSKEEIQLKTNYLFILSSTHQGWNYFLDKHDPIGRFFRKREKIELLSKEETIKVVVETLKNTGVRFSREIINLIYEYTKGHPYELQVLCSNLYEAQMKGAVSHYQWKKILQKTLDDLGGDYFDSLFRKASDREETILKVLCQEKKEMSIKDIQDNIPNIDKSFLIKDVRLYLYRLEDKGLIKQVNKNRYCLIDNMFQEYLLLHL